jgi:hypothetical protein
MPVAALPIASWQDTQTTLQRWVQMVGKTRLALEPPRNHWWHTALYVSSRGLGTGPMPSGAGTLELDFDFLSHRLSGRRSDGREASIALRPVTVAEFFSEYRALLAELGAEVRIYPVPMEMEDTLRFDQDEVHGAYDATAVQRWWGMLREAHEILTRFRGLFLGKCSPVHFWWGAFDLSCTRFSGRRAPLHPGGLPHVPDWVTREGYSHECISAGWWPGGGAIAEPAWYAYAYPEPQGCPSAQIAPEGAGYHPEMREWLLLQSVADAAPDPRAAVDAFLASTWQAAADLGGWDRAALESPDGYALRRE